MTRTETAIDNDGNYLECPTALTIDFAGKTAARDPMIRITREFR
jgi:hypothetical protein